MKVKYFTIYLSERRKSKFLNQYQFILLIMQQIYTYNYGKITGRRKSSIV